MSKGSIRSGEAARLGNATELRTPPSKVEKINEARRLRYSLQDQARLVLWDADARKNSKGYQVQHRTCTCNRLSISEGADIYKSREHSKAHYGGLMRCANSRTCPVCAATISERKGNELRLAANQREALGLKFSLLTFTAPHTQFDRLDVLKQQMLDACAAFWRGSPAKRFKEKYGIVGHIRSFEVRYGSNGWHPHFHIIVVSKRELPSTRRVKGKVCLSEQSEDWIKVLEMWQSAARRSGLKAPNEHGMDLQNGTEAGEYITKYGGDDEILKTKKGKSVTWDMADEMTKGHIKTGKDSLSPFEILALSGNAETEEERKKYTLLFREWSKASERLTMLKWSRGLRALFGLSKTDRSDEQILAEQDDKADLLCHVSTKQWQYIVCNGLRAKLLELAEGKDPIRAICEFMDEHNLDHVSLKRENEFEDLKRGYQLVEHRNTRSKISKVEKVWSELAIESDSVVDSIPIPDERGEVCHLK
ncbi:TPA: protein rep [Vibrio parahaemolyticus]|nr:protein rep [Vibrio parahaemolyticus]